MSTGSPMSRNMLTTPPMNAVGREDHPERCSPFHDIFSEDGNYRLCRCRELGPPTPPLAYPSIQGQIVPNLPLLGPPCHTADRLVTTGS